MDDGGEASLDLGANVRREPTTNIKYYKFKVLGGTKANRVISDRRDGTRGVLTEERQYMFTYMKQLERGN